MKLYQFSLQCQLMTEIWRCPLFPYRLWRVCISQHGGALYWHRCAVWTIRLGSSDWNQQYVTASAGCLLDPTTTVWLIGPANVVSRTTFFAAAHSYCWCTEPACPGWCHHGVSHMWRMMNTVLQQQQHMVYPGFGPGTPRTPLYQNAGTPVGTSRCPCGMTRPRFSAPTPVPTTPPGMSIVVASTVFLAGKTTNQTTTSLLPQDSGEK